jgi:protein-disulfide isomerase
MITYTKTKLLWTRKKFYLRFAKSKLKLDANKIKSEVDKQAYSSRIREDFVSGVRSGVNGTPTFFVNRTRHHDSYEFDSLSKAIDSQSRK